MFIIILNAILIWIVLLISLKLIKRGDVIKELRLHVSVIGIAITAYILNAILLSLYVKIFGQFNMVTDSFIDGKIAIIGFLALLIATFLFLLFINKLTAKQSLILGIVVGLFANYAFYLPLILSPLRGAFTGF